MFYCSLAMDHTFLPRSVWSGDSKFLHHPADLYTSVVVTRGIPAGTCFGPCVLQNTFYDTIAFIAQKSCDKTAKSYVFRVSCPAVLQHGHLVFREMAPARSLAVVSYYITRGGSEAGDFRAVVFWKLDLLFQFGLNLHI